MNNEGYKPRIMVSSSVYGFENELNQICVLLQEMGYEVWNSHLGTIKVNHELSNMGNCLKAVEECDLFLGIIRTTCGTGNIDDKNITFEEMKRAVELKKPYWFLSHRDVVFARQLFKNIEGLDPTSIRSKDKRYFDPLCIDMYNFVIKDDVPVTERKGNWIQQFYKFDEIATYLQTQFQDISYIMNKIQKEGK